MSAASLIANHLNAPYGRIVTEGDVLSAIRDGSTVGLSDMKSSLISSMFTECRPELIARCASEAGINLKGANDLYLSILNSDGVQSLDWEKCFKEYA
jgi:hypothetical protein